MHQSTMSLHLAPGDFATPDRGQASSSKLNSARATKTSASCLKKENGMNRQERKSFSRPPSVTPETQQESVTREHPHMKRLDGPATKESKCSTYDQSPHLPRLAGDIGSPAATQPITSQEVISSLPTTHSKIRHYSNVGGKHVRFGGDGNDSLQDIKLEGQCPASSTNGDSSKTLNNSNQRGLVSRRGGRYVSPGRAALKPKSTSHKDIFQSPLHRRDENDTVPSLCSTKSGELSSSEFSRHKIQTAPANSTSEKILDGKCVGSVSKSDALGDRKPTSISCDPSMIHSTSPLASKETVKSNTRKLDATAKKNRTSSPRPTRNSLLLEKGKKTPTKSPSRAQFQTLPSLDNTRGVLASPGIFLSPATYKTLQGSFDKAETKEEKSSDEGPREALDTKKTQERASTPTDFSLDYGKDHHMSGAFDTSNVLAWLQSPTANGLFSPGGFGSIVNTPRGFNGPRTPRSPAISSSFFFSDVAGLPRGGEITPKADQGKKSQKSYSNIICISPLASSRHRNGAPLGNTPINFKDVFASPNPDVKNNPHSMPLLGDSPTKVSKSRRNGSHRSRDPSLDAVNLEERDLMEDEDLSVLLQLASNTPKNSAGMHVFRSPCKGHLVKGNSVNGSENLPALQLPIIGNRQGDSTAARLSRKSQSRDHNAGGGFSRPTLGMRSSSMGGSKDLYVDKGRPGARKLPKDTPSPFLKKKVIDESKGTGSGKKSGKKQIANGSNPFSLPHQYSTHPGCDRGYYPLPGGVSVMPPGGSMRVVVGGLPPSNRNNGKSSSTTPNRRMSGSPPRRPPPYPQNEGSYPPPGISYPPPPPGHYTHHPPVPPHMTSMGVHPYHGHYPPHHPPPPPPRHMPMYGAQHQPGSASKIVKKGKQGKPGKATLKRISSLDISGKNMNSSKKQKKASPSGAPKKKNKSPQLTDHADRQKAAVSIAKINVSSGGKNDRAAALAAAILRGVTMRPSGKWQAQLYFAGKSRYIGVFDTREKAALAYEIAREKLKSDKSQQEAGGLSTKATEAAVNSARKAAFEGVNERDPRLASSK